MKTSRWQDIKDRHISPERQEKLRQHVNEELLAMDLRAIRELAGKTQVEVAETLNIAQSEVSRIERRPDYHLSTLRRFVAALGGELEVTARIGDKRVLLHSAVVRSD